MYDYIVGKVTYIKNNSIVLDNNGIGYLVNVSNPYSYELGKEVYPDDFDENRYYECSHGIHFFMSFDEARDYYLM